MVEGEWIGVDVSTTRRPILRRDDGEGYRELLTWMAQESGIETPPAEDLPRGRPQVEGQDAAERRPEELTDPEATHLCQGAAGTTA